MAKHILDSFTKMNSITKTLEFELIPVPDTAEMIRIQKMDEYDASIEQLIADIAPLVDIAIRDIMDTALDMTDADFAAYNPKNQEKAEREKAEKDIISEITKALNAAASKVDLKNIKKINSAEFLANVLPEYIDVLDDDEKQKATENIKRLKGKASLMSPFLNTRVTALETWMPKRVLENLEQYRANAETLEKLLTSQVANDIYKLYPDIARLTDIKNYKDFLTQSGIDTYNTIICGKQDGDRIIEKGIINIVMDNNNNSGKKLLPRPRKLKKQILSPVEKAYIVKTIGSDDEVKECLQTLLPEFIKKAKETIEDLENIPATGIVVKYNNLHTLSLAVFNDHKLIPHIIEAEAIKELKEQLSTSKSKKNRESLIGKIDAISRDLGKKQYTLQEIFNACTESSDLSTEQMKDRFYDSINKDFSEAYELSRFLLNDIGNFDDIKENREEIIRIKNVFDVWTRFRNNLRAISRLDNSMGDEIFYSKLEDNAPELASIWKAQSMIVSYITRKPGENARNKATYFGKANRNDSEWMKPGKKMEQDELTLLKENGKIYMLAPGQGAKTIDITGNGTGKLFVQKKLTDAFKLFPRIGFNKSCKQTFDADPSLNEFIITDKMKAPVTVTRDIYETYKRHNYTKDAINKGVSAKEQEADFKTILRYYMCIAKNWTELNHFDIKLKPEDAYTDLKTFFSDIDACLHVSEWVSADDEKIEELVRSGQLLKFLVNSREMYMDMKENRDTYVKTFLTAISEDPQDIMILSNPKFSFTKATIPLKITHKKNSFIVNKYDKDGNKIPEDIYTEIYGHLNNMISADDLSEKAESYLRNGKAIYRKAPCDIIKDATHTRDKYKINITIKKNASVIEASDITAEINKHKESMNILALTRSADDLIYYAVTDNKGNRIESGSLNTIRKRDYWTELKNLNDKRRLDKAESLKYDSRVKNIRDAYISDAISFITRKVVEYNAIIVCEWLSDAEKDKGSALDNTVYKSFEKKLTARLSDLHFGNIPMGQPGSTSNPYQLCNNNGNEFQDGIVHFISRAYTRSVDLETGFTNLFISNSIRNKTDRMEFLSKFKSIRYDEDKKMFLFEFNYTDFITKVTEPINKNWTIIAGGEDVLYDREHKVYKYVSETISPVIDEIKKAKHGFEKDFAELARNAELSIGELTAFTTLVLRAATGIVGRHDGIRKTYVSPITENKTDYAELATLALVRKYIWLKTVKEGKAKGEWVTHIATMLP